MPIVSLPPPSSIDSAQPPTHSPTTVGPSSASKLEQLERMHAKLQEQLALHRSQQAQQAQQQRHQVRPATQASNQQQHLQATQQQQSQQQRAFYPTTPATTNAELVQNLRKSGVVRSDAVATAMEATDRALYLPLLEPLDSLTSYADMPSMIGYNQTISAPHMHAHALELCFDAIQTIEAPRILDIGAGSGYLTACFARLARAQQGRVFGVEVISALAQTARMNIQSDDAELAATVHCANGWDGLTSDAPFDFIHVGAAASEPPQALLDQLADGGRMVVPLDQHRGGGQMLVEITRAGDTFTQRPLMGVCYVPLVRSRRPSV